MLLTISSHGVLAVVVVVSWMLSRTLRVIFSFVIVVTIDRRVWGGGTQIGRGGNVTFFPLGFMLEPAKEGVQVRGRALVEWSNTTLLTSLEAIMAVTLSLGHYDSELLYDLVTFAIEVVSDGHQTNLISCDVEVVEWDGRLEDLDIIVLDGISIGVGVIHLSESSWVIFSSPTVPEDGKIGVPNGHGTDMSGFLLTT